MAQVTTPSGTGTLGGVIIIDSLGRVRVWVRPKDPRSAAQLRFRQLMRGLYTVLPKFSDPVDADLRAQSTPQHRWSSYTFAQWAADHGDAINGDLPYYGASYR